ncbi:uncharacterized protein LOC134538637 [Bacillus rossius redtenbacheri]|uniref:uncharacterized protein LOC134538637 n=1 Tax=Bacillus rossius redtenbacheri TaxID=93214 RepID=UPI002FDD516A
MATVTITAENVSLLSAENYSKLHSKNVRIIGSIVSDGRDFSLVWCGGSVTGQKPPALKLDVTLLREDILTRVPVQVYGELTLDEGQCLRLKAHFYRDFRSVNVGYYEAAAASLQDQIRCPLLVSQAGDIDDYISEVTEQLLPQ